MINLDRFTLWSLIEQKDHPLISRLFSYAGTRLLAGFHQLSIAHPSERRSPAQRGQFFIGEIIPPCQFSDSYDKQTDVYVKLTPPAL